MCGINGIFVYGSQAVEPCEQECLKVRDAMTSRGPDDRGFFHDPDRRVLLGHRRLEIIDLSAQGAQPMASADGNLVITFNGEIYNYQELRAELIDDGVRFASTSDTEVLLHLYRHQAETMVHRLEGMFAFAIWDRQRSTLFLTRDPHGIKPLYYADDGSCFRFASSVQALLAGGGISREPDPLGIVGFLAWGSVPEPGTLFRQVRSLPAGSTLRVTPGRVEEPQRYWSLASVYQEAVVVPEREELNLRVRDALRESVARHLVADVPVGLFLSAGVDSGALLGLASEVHPEPLRTVTLAFEEFRGRPEDEAPLAKQVAQHYGAQHTTVTLSAREARDAFDVFLEAMDQPTVDGLNVYFVSRAVRQAGLKAALSGVGGDELFGGYSTFRAFKRLRRVSWLAQVPGLLRLAGALGPARRQAKLRYASSALARPASTYHLLRCLFTPIEIRSLIRPEIWQAAGGAEKLTRTVEDAWQPAPANNWACTSVAEQSVYMRHQLLRDADWASMSHSLEVRTPLVDRRLTNSLGALLAATGGGESKEPLASSPQPPLPQKILTRPKTGFGLPLQTWVGEDCRAGRIPNLPSWLADTKQQALVSRLAEGTARGRVHWSRIWALKVLGHLLPESW